MPIVEYDMDYDDTLNLYPTEKFLEKITEFYIKGSDPNIVLDNGTLQNGTFIATFSGSIPQFIGNTVTGLFCISQQDQITGEKVEKLNKNDVKIIYNSTTASYNISLNKRFSPSTTPKSFALGIDSGSSVDLLFAGEIQNKKLKNLAPMKQRFLDTFDTFFGTNSEYEWYAGLATFPSHLNINSNEQLANFVVRNSSSDFINNAITIGGISSGVGTVADGSSPPQYHKYGTGIEIVWNESSTCVTSVFSETTFAPSQTDLLYNSMFIFGIQTTEKGSDTLVSFAGETPKSGVLMGGGEDNKDKNLVDYFAFYPKVDIKTSEVIII
jgi:hypothetical protein